MKRQTRKNGEVRPKNSISGAATQLAFPDPKGPASKQASMDDRRMARVGQNGWKSFAGAGSQRQQVVVFYGPSGLGRSRLVQKLVYSNPSLFSVVAPHTTRKKRPYETEGRDLVFLSQTEMAAEIERGRFVAYDRVTKDSRRGPDWISSVYDLSDKDRSDGGGELFGISWSSLDAACNEGKPIVVVNVNTTGAAQIKRAGVEAFYVLVHTGRGEDAARDDIGPDRNICISDLAAAGEELELLVRELAAIEADGDADGAQRALEKARLDWDLVPTLQISKEMKREMVEHHRSVSFVEMLVHVQGKQMLHGVGGAKSASGKRAADRSAEFSSKSLQSEYATVLQCARSHIDDADPVHAVALQTVYKRLTGNKVNCPKIGSHWQSIGFQSNDPADDLAEAGLLGLMQLLFVVDDLKTLQLAKDILALDGHSSTPLPFCTLSLRATRLVLKALREHQLDKKCKKRDQIFQVINEFYLGLMITCYQIAKGHPHHNVDGLLTEVGRQASSKGGIKSILGEAQKLLNDHIPTSAPVPVSKALSPSAFSFTRL